MKKSLNTSALVTADSRKGQRATETFRAQYNKAKLDDDSAQRLNEHPGFAVYLAEGIRRFSTKAFDYSLAQSILGADFITPEEVMKARPRIVYSVEQITALTESLPSEDVLTWCRENGYAVIPAPPTAMSTLDVGEIQSPHFYAKISGWYADLKFVNEDKTSFEWLLIKKTPVLSSTSMTWSEQNKLLSALEKMPKAAEMCWFIMTYFEVRGVRLFERGFVRTSSLTLDNRCVDVGYFSSEGLSISLYWADHRDDDLGVSVARKQ